MERIQKLYLEIFDEQGNVKAVGREKCKELISLMNTHYGKNGEYGNERTGQMDVEKILKQLKTD